MSGSWPLSRSEDRTPAGRGVQVRSFHSRYDANDNRTAVDEGNGAASADRRYCYDARNQLVFARTGAACSAGAHDEAWTYDEAGNRRTALSGAATTNFEYTADGLLCDVESAPTAASCSGGNVTSDSAGRISDRAGWHYLYDAEGRLTAACQDADCVGSGFARVDVAYDGEGHRTSIVETPAVGPAVTWTFRYRGDAVVQEARNGTVVRDYVVDEAGTIQKVVVAAGQTGAGTYLVTWNGHGDALGLWRIESNGSLTLANSYTYDTWGRPSTATHSRIADLGFRFLYVGAHGVAWDDPYGLGLMSMRARHYDPALGRFLQPDPAAIEANLYAYVSNSPVTRVDPSGMFGWAVCGIPFITPVCVKVGTDAVVTIWGAFLLVTGIATTVRGDTGIVRASPRVVWVFGTATSIYRIMSRTVSVAIAMTSLHRHIRAGTAPWGPAGGFKDVHPGHVPGSLPHVHVNGGAIDIPTGRVRPGHPLKAPLTNRQREFLRKHGVPVP